jgi:hypothetical protein
MDALSITRVALTREGLRPRAMAYRTARCEIRSKSAARGGQKVVRWKKVESTVGSASSPESAPDWPRARSEGVLVLPAHLRGAPAHGEAAGSRGTGVLRPQCGAGTSGDGRNGWQSDRGGRSPDGAERKAAVCACGGAALRG